MKSKISLAGMHCTSCAMTIDDELEQLTGVKRVKTSYARAMSEVEYDPELVTTEQLLAAIEAAGYHGTVNR